MSSTLKELLERNSVRTYGVGEHHHARYGWVQIDCPWCNRPGGAHLGINLKGNYAACWRCGPKRLGDILVQAARIPLRDAIEFVKSLPKYRPDTDAQTTATGRLVIPVGVGPLQRAHINYLRGRGYTRDVVPLWGAAGIGIAPRLGWRVFLPITHRGRTVSWTTRAISDNADMRYISASPEEEAINHKSILYGIDYVRHAAIVHEGPLDVWSVGPGAVATLGTSYTRAQVLALSRIPVRAICFDNEPEAQIRAARLVNDLAPFPGKTFNVKLDAKDASSATEDERILLRNSFLV